MIRPPPLLDHMSRCMMCTIKYPFETDIDYLMRIDRSHATETFQPHERRSIGSLNIDNPKGTLSALPSEKNA
jgi:hypothetical protein